jgi:[acyl-carrier-protein] S-malonyltransferase
MLAPWIEDGESKELLIQWSDAIGLDLVHLGVHAGLLSARALNLSSRHTFSFVAGHSVGEITAAAIAGVLTPLDAMKLVRLRGVEMAKAASLSPSGMSAVLGGDREVVLRAIADAGLIAANDNGGGQIVAAGDLAALSTLAPEGARVRALAVAGAFHTSYMEPAVEPMRALAAEIEVNDATVGVLSNKDGAVINSGREILDRIVNQIANPVRWDLCMETLASNGVTGVIEVAPAGTLVGLIKRAVPTIEQCALKSPAELEAATTFASHHGGQ